MNLTVPEADNPFRAADTFFDDYAKFPIVPGDHPIWTPRILHRPRSRARFHQRSLPVRNLLRRHFPDGLLRIA